MASLSKTYILELTELEVKVLKDILGMVALTGPPRDVSSEIYDALPTFEDFTGERSAFTGELKSKPIFPNRYGEYE